MTVDDAITRLAREDSGRVLALLARRFGDVDLADESVQAALVEAARWWPERGVPDNPAAWLLSVARRKAIDLLRRADAADRRIAAAAPHLVAAAEDEGSMTELLIDDDGDIPDERLRLVMLCCHPALNSEAQVALTLRLVGGLTTEEIAAAFLVPVPTLAQRISRAKKKIREAGIPLSVPADQAARTAEVLRVLYLTFNEGYLSRSEGEDVARLDLCAEAIRLTRVMAGLVPDNPEVLGLLALELFHHARRNARFAGGADLVLLGDQDRTQWSLDEIGQGNVVLRDAMQMMQPGPYQLQAVIASHHVNARTAEDTDWSRIAALYAQLEVVAPSSVVSLNRAVAVAMADGPAAGLQLLDGLVSEGVIGDYYLFHSARGELLARAGKLGPALEALGRALELTTNAAERRHLERRLADLGRPS